MARSTAEDRPDPYPTKLSQTMDTGRLLELFKEARSLAGPELEAFLRKARDEDSELGASLAELVGPPGPAPAVTVSFAKQLKEQYGSKADPHIALESEAEAADFASEIVERLAGREGAFGRYELKGELARGGQGAILRVWDQDLRRNLAMKVTLGRDEPGSGETTSVDLKTLGRFLEEAQVTGQLDHPGIVPVHELGLDSTGEVYFTMKLVKGQDLSAIFELVREAREGWNRTRALGVMLKVCEAMAYAHSKGVIHRDLKPANVMVGKYGEVYVMDWGLARVFGQEDERDLRIRPSMKTSAVHSDRREASTDLDSPLVTMDGDVVGTPAFMSPEQARGDLDAMGPPSDVFAAGAMLYHLLTGHMPYVPPGARLNNYAVWSHVQSGPPPSLNEVAPDAPAELVAICERAMAREPGDRYADMEALAVDLRAFLEQRVVSAYETGTVAQLRKWVARNKPLAVASAAAVLALVAGLATSSTLYLEAEEKAEEASTNAETARANEARMRTERDRADANAAEAAKQAATARAEAERATREEATTERVLAFLTGMFDQQAPDESWGARITVKEVLDRNAPGLMQELEDEPEIRARLMTAMGRLYESLGLNEEAEPLLEGALSVWRTELGEGHPETLSAQIDLAWLRSHQGRFAEAEALFEQTLEWQRAGTGEDHADTLGTLDSLAGLAAVRNMRGHYAEAEPLLLEVLAGRREALGEDHPSTVSSLHDLAWLYVSQGHYAQAEPLLLRVLELRRAAHGENHPHTVAALRTLAWFYEEQGRYAEAVAHYETTLERSRAVLGEDHLDTIQTLSFLARAYAEAGRYEEAETVGLQALEKRRAVLGEDHPATLGSLSRLALQYARQGRYEEAETLLRQAFEKRQALLGEDHSHTLNSLNHLARLYLDQGRYAEAEPLYVQVLEKSRALLGEEHPETLVTQNDLATVYANQENFAEAELLYLHSLETFREVLSEDHANTLTTRDNLIGIYRAWLSDRRAQLGEDHLDTLAVQGKLGAALLSRGDHEEAEPLLLECLAMCTELLGEEHPDTLTALYHVARLHESRRRWEEAEVAAGWLLELTPEDDEEYVEREQLLERILRARESAE